MSKIILADRNNPNDRRDITDLADSWHTAPNGRDVRVNYSHTIVNGKKVKNRCQVLHENSTVIVER